MTVVFLSLSGEFDVQFLYLKKKVGWTVSEISSYNTFNTAVQAVGEVLIVIQQLRLTSP